MEILKVIVDKVPSNCTMCDLSEFNVLHDMVCRITGVLLDDEQADFERHFNCPLVEKGVDGNE